MHAMHAMRARRRCLAEDACKGGEQQPGPWQTVLQHESNPPKQGFCELFTPPAAEAPAHLLPEEQCQLFSPQPAPAHAGRLLLQQQQQQQQLPVVDLAAYKDSLCSEGVASCRQGAGVAGVAAGGPPQAHLLSPTQPLVTCTHRHAALPVCNTPTPPLLLPLSPCAHAGYSGNLCGVCLPGYAKVRTHTCKRCQSAAAILGLYLLAALTMLGVMKMVLVLNARDCQADPAALLMPMAVRGSGPAPPAAGGAAADAGAAPLAGHAIELQMMAGAAAAAGAGTGAGAAPQARASAPGLSSSSSIGSSMYTGAGPFAAAGPPSCIAFGSNTSQSSSGGGASATVTVVARSRRPQPGSGGGGAAAAAAAPTPLAPASRFSRTGSSGGGSSGTAAAGAAAAGKGGSGSGSSSRGVRRWLKLRRGRAASAPGSCGSGSGGSKQPKASWLKDVAPTDIAKPLILYAQVCVVAGAAAGARVRACRPARMCCVVRAVA
jgi:hypothetical protein